MVYVNKLGCCVELWACVISERVEEHIVNRKADVKCEKLGHVKTAQEDLDDSLPGLLKFQAIRGTPSYGYKAWECKLVNDQRGMESKVEVSQGKEKS